jgi:hypothetical protein
MAVKATMCQHDSPLVAEANCRLVCCVDEGREQTCEGSTIMRNLTGHSTRGRIVAGFVMGLFTLALVGLTTVLGPMGRAALVDPLVQLMFPAAAIVTVLIAALSSSARTAWGRLCLMNGVVGLAFAGVNVENGPPLWPTDPVYERALDQAMQWWVMHLIWTTGAYFTAALIIAAVLFALSYWLLRSPHRQHLEAH